MTCSVRMTLVNQNHSAERNPLSRDPQDLGSNLMIWGGADVITIKIKCTVNVMCLNHPHHPPSRSVEKPSSTKPVPGARKVGGPCCKGPALNCHRASVILSSVRNYISLPTVTEHSLHPPTCLGPPLPVQRFGCRESQYQASLMVDSHCRVQRLGKWLVQGNV